MTWRTTRLISVSGGLALILMQLVPTPTRTNPVTAGGVHMTELIDPAAGKILDRSCQDCHSTSGHMPWYGHVAPVSWLVSRDVNRGLQKLDFSNWTRQAHSANERMEICDAVSDGSMPLAAYRLLHKDARLSKQDIDVICDWATGSQTPEPAASRGTGETARTAEAQTSSKNRYQR